MAADTKLGTLPLLSNQGGIHHLAPGVHLLQLWANMVIVDTAEGVVLFDSGFEFNGPRLVEEIRAITDQPVRYVIYGHGHGDHAFGGWAVVKAAEERGHPRPLIIAHENLPRRFDRYQEMLAYHEHINRIQFAIPDNLPAFSRRFLYPDLTYRDTLSFRLGGLTFELRHAKGETDDTTWIWIPEKKTVCTSDLWVWSCPNIGNPFKVQRYEVEWARALSEIAGLGADLLLPGHGPALAGREEIRTACLTVARALHHLHEEVVRMLNQGKWPEEILQSFTWPEEFARSPWLAPIYGHPYFIVHGILRRYHGWYDGNPSRLFPAASAIVAREITGLIGQPEKILGRARELGDQGHGQLALHLVDLLIQSAEPPPAEALELKARLLQQLADRESSLIARNIFLAGVRQIQKALAEEIKGEDMNKEF